MSTPIIAFKQESVARLLANYMRTQGVAVTVMPTAEQEFVLLLEAGQDEGRARQLCEAFIRHPNDPKYQQSAWQESEQVELANKRSFNFSNVLPFAKQAPFTFAILVICAVIFGLSLLGWFSPIANAIAIQPLGVLMQNHEWWRLIGPAFLHFSVIHIVFNLLWWGILGSQIERVLGMSMLVIVFVVSAVLSNVAQLLVSGPAFGGLSGVVYALLGFVWWLGWLKPAWGIQLPRAIVGFMLFWLVLGYADVLWVNVANTAHTVGLVSGCLLAGVLSLGADRRKHQP